MTYRNAPIKQKLLVIIMATTAIALVLAGAGILVLESMLFRSQMQRDLTALASIVGDNSTAALQFDDARVANETLSALRARSHMAGACLYQADGSLFAQYSRPGTKTVCPPPQSRAGVDSTGAGLSVWHPIILNGDRIGTLLLLYDRGEVWERIRLYGAVLLPILLASSLLALVLSSRLRAMIAAPISRLAQAAGSVSESGDYGIRVTKDSVDELGILVDAFNEMLRHVQSRDADVQNARNSLETTLTSIADAVISTDSEGRLVFANPVAQRLLGWPGVQMTGKPVGEIFRIENEFTGQPLESPVQTVLHDGAIVGLAGDTLLRARDGKGIPIDASAAPIQQAGRTVGVVLVFRDITDRRRAQQDAAYLAAIVESSDDAIVGKSPEGVIQTWNAGAERLYGYRADEVIGRPMLELLPTERMHEELEILKQLREGNRVVHFETMRVRKDGSSVDVSLTISPILDKDGHLQGISDVARDITEQKRTAEQIRQTQKLESLGVLAGGIAHDFNNLLTGILGNASIALEDSPDEAPQREAIEAVIAASERAAQLARQMLAYSGKGRFVLENVDLSERVRDILPLIKAAIPATIEVRLNVEEQLPLVEADAAQMQQLVMNVIINGAESVPEGAPGSLTITTRRQQVDDAYIREVDNAGTGDLSPGLYAVFEVEDTGCGMDEVTLGRIFDPFFTTKFTGRGLGLAAVLGIVRGHRGCLQVSSEVGRGTRFRFLFPAVEAARENKAAAEPPRSTVGHRGSGLVLVVDDEPIVLKMAKHGLERHGYTVAVAEDGARGLEIFRRDAERIRCVVLDLTMPVMSGEETMALMRAVRPDVPIILSSGFNEAQAVQRFEGKGLAGFLQKPYRSAALVEKIDAVVSITEPRQ